MTTATQNGAPREQGAAGDARGAMGPDDRPIAVIRRSPEDFVVEELPAYAPSGQGEHLLVTFQKRALTTPDAVRMIARALDVDPRGAGFAGMKDRHAVTTQTASFPLPLARGDAETAVASLSLPGIKIVGAARHANKLKPGHLIGNRFTITLRDVPEEAIAAVCDELIAIGRRGVPNAFGPQRFGRDGDNPERALAWLGGRARPPRDKREQRLLFSALQSLLFNRVLARRVADGTWATVLPGDVAKKRDTGGIFTVPLEGPELDDARARAEAGALSATGPMFGAKMRWPEGEPLELERAVLATVFDDLGRLDAFRHLGEGTRRPLRLEVSEMEVHSLAASGGTDRGAAAGAAGIVVRFVLPKGGYATTVLGQAVHLVDASTHANPDREGRDSAADRPGDDEEDVA